MIHQVASSWLFVAILLGISAALIMNDKGGPDAKA